MNSRFFNENGNTFFKAVLISVAFVTLALVTTMCAPPATPTPEAVEEVPEVTEAVEEMPDEAAMDATLAIEHFSIIEGTTWSGAHDRAGQRIAEKYPEVTYVLREEVGPDLTVPYAEELIDEG